jgi:oligosaccharide repeat unit polymerase
VFGLNEIGPLDGKFLQTTVIDTLFLVTVGVLAFHLGGVLAIGKRSDPPPDVDPDPAITPATRAIRVVGWVLIVVSFPFSLLALRDAIRIVLAGGYASLFQQEADIGIAAGPQILASFLVPGALFLLAGSKDRRANIIVSMIVVVSYATVQLFLGRRSVAALSLVAYAWLWHRRIRPLSASPLIGVLLGVLLILMPLVRAIRNLPGQERLNVAYMAEVFFSIQNPTVAAIHEIGASMQTIAYTLEFVPYIRAFEYGTGYLYAVLALIPNLFWDIHPAVVNQPSRWLVETVAPVVAAAGGGLGYSLIAEAYLNFGWFGAPVAIGLIGFLYAKLVMWGDRPDRPSRLALMASFLSFFLMYARSDATGILRFLVWYSLLPYLAVQLLIRGPRTRTKAA